MRTPLLAESNPSEPSSGFKSWIVKNKTSLIRTISIFNGVLYFVIAFDGGKNIENIFDLSGKSGNISIIVVSVGAGIVYTMFTYKTLEALSLKIDSRSKVFFSFLAPFSAAAFLTAGEDGSRSLGFNEGGALAMGILLFGLRMMNCIDASVKFPDRFLETRRAWNAALTARNYAELSRLIVIWIASIGYVLCTTDAVFNATQIILGWFGLSADNAEVFCYIASVLGALGTLPLNVYWSYRGLRQLTFGGIESTEGINPDPTDRYTYIGLILVSPVILGILGGATASTGQVFGRLGIFSEVLRVTSSVFYAACAGTPGMATLLRSTVAYVTSLRKHEVEERAGLLRNSESAVENPSPKRTWNWWCCKRSEEKAINSSEENFSQKETPSKRCNIL